MRTKPRNDLEQAILAVNKNSTRETAHEMLRQYWQSAIAIPSRTPVETDLRELTPALNEYEGTPVLYAFSDPDRATPFALQYDTKYMAILTGRRLAGVKAPTVGVLLNPSLGDLAQYLHPGPWRWPPRRSAPTPCSRPRGMRRRSWSL